MSLESISPAAPRWPATPDDRRESPRLPIAMAVRAGEVQREAAAGNLSLGGVGWLGAARPSGTMVEVALRLGEDEELLTVTAEVIRATPQDGQSWVQARFVELGLGAELRIARWLQRQLDAGT